MFQFFNPFRSETKLSSQNLHRTHNIDQTTPSKYQTAFKNQMNPMLQHSSISQNVNDKITFQKTTQNSFKDVQKRQFFTVNFEIVLKGQKYKFVKIFTDGQFIGNFKNAGDQVLCEECHFAVLQKLKSKTQEKNNDFPGKQESVGELYRCNELQTKTNYLDKNLECIVFELRFGNGKDSPIHILHKSPFIFSQQFVATKSHKNQTESFMLKLIQTNSLDEKDSFEAIKKSPIRYSMKYRFKSIEDFSTIKLFVSERLNNLLKIKARQEENALVNESSKFKDNFFIENFSQENKKGENEQFAQLHEPKVEKKQLKQIQVPYIKQENNEQKYLPKIHPLYPVPLKQMEEESELKPEIISFVDFQDQSELHDKNFWKKSHAKTYQNLPEDAKKTINYQQQTFSNQKTIPQKIDQHRNEPIDLDFKQEYDNQSIKNFSNQDSQMVQEDIVQIYQMNFVEKEKYESESKLNKNPEFQLTTLNRFQTNRHASNKTFQNEQIHKMQEENKIIPQKLTFEDKIMEKEDLQPHQLKSSDIDNYRIDEENYQEIGGYESEDQSQEAESSNSSQMEIISAERTPFRQQEQFLEPEDNNKQENDQKPIKETKESMVPQTFISLSMASIGQKQKQRVGEEKFQTLDQVVKAEKLAVKQQDLTQNAKTNQVGQIQELQNAQYKKSTYSLIRNSDKSILCIQILKQQGKIYKTSTGHPKSKDDLVKLMLYDPLILENIHSRSNLVQNKFYNMKSFRETLQKVDRLQVSSDEKKALLYSTSEQSHPIVLQYSIETQRFTSIYKIPSPCNKLNLTPSPLPLLQVKYLNNNSTQQFLTITSKQICLYSKNAHKYPLNSSSQHQYHRVFVYRNLFAQKKLDGFEFDTFEMHQDGRYLVVGMGGKYVKLFDMERQVEDWQHSQLGDQQKDAGNKQCRVNRIKGHQQRIRRIRRLKDRSESKNKVKKIISKYHRNKLSPYSKPPLHDRYKLYYLKALNSFNLQDDQTITPAPSQQKISSYSQQIINSQQQKNQSSSSSSHVKITNIKLIYSSAQQLSKEYPHRKVEHIYCSRSDGKRFLINCVEESHRMGEVNCFGNKLRRNNRSLIRVIGEEEASLLLLRE